LDDRGDRRPPIIKNLLNYGSLLLKRIGLDGDTEFNHIFADRYGRLLSKIGAFLQVSGLNVQGCMVARAALWHLLDAAGLHGKASVIREKFPFNTKHLKIVRIINILKKD